MEAGQEPKVPAWPACGLWHYLTRFRYAQSLRPNRSQEEDTTEGESRVKPDHSVGSSWEFPKGHSGYAEVMTVRQDSSAIAMVLRHFDGRLSRGLGGARRPDGVHRVELRALIPSCSTGRAIMWRASDRTDARARISSLSATSSTTERPTTRNGI